MNPDELMYSVVIFNLDMDFIDVPLTVAGWGKTRQGALTSSRYLQETKVKIVNSDECTKSSVYRDNLVPDGMMCAYNLGKDACQVKLKFHTFSLLDVIVPAYLSTVTSSNSASLVTRGPLPPFPLSILFPPWKSTMHLEFF